MARESHPVARGPEGSPSPARFTMPTGRLEAFSDSVFAFAITLLVLNFQVPHAPSGGLARALLDQWPSYLTYVVSFFVIGIMWINHYAIFRLIARVDRPMLVMNLVHLLGVAFLPYPTALLGAYIQSEQDARVASVLYAGTATVIAIGFMGFWVYAVLHGLLRDGVDRARALASIPRLGISLLAYSLAMVVAFFSEPLSLALIALIHVYYLFNPIAETIVGD
ncbi:MAG TPA: TMEM175 family protein [Chloroflexota bacterium]|nr:TMEM175 family protein [Chloroflexota bacterium]